MNNMNEWLVFVVSFVSCVLCQAPGDGDPICVQEVVEGLANPFFALHPTYPANERPLMDSRDYTDLLQGRNPPVWQHVDNDNNNTVTDVTNVRYFSMCVSVCACVCVCVHVCVCVWICRQNELQAAYFIYF